jgi:glutamate transport system substrate-binding protein
MRAMRRRWSTIWFSLMTACVLLAAAACSHARHPAHQAVHSRFYGNAKLRIGINPDQPGVGHYESKTNQWSGMDVAVADYLLTYLHVPFSRDTPHIAPVQTGDRDDHMLNHTDDLVIASYSITDARIAKGISFTIPYLLSFQDILIRSADIAAIKSVNDLAGKRVCTPPETSTPYQHLVTLNQKSHLGATLDPEPGNQICVDKLLGNKTDAVVTDSAILYGFQATNPSLHLVGTKVWPRPEQYGVGLIAETPADVSELNTAIKHMITDESWRKAVITSFCPGAHPTDPPCPVAKIFLDSPPPTN